MPMDDASLPFTSVFSDGAILTITTRALPITLALYDAVVDTRETAPARVKRGVFSLPLKKVKHAKWPSLTRGQRLLARSNSRLPTYDHDHRLIRPT